MAIQPNALDYLSKATDTPKVNLFDFSSVKQPSFGQEIQQAQPTQPSIQQPVQQTNVIQDFLNQTKGNTEFTKKRKVVIEMLQNEEDEAFIQDTITNKMQFAGIEQDINQLGLGQEAVQRAGDVGTALSERASNVGESFSRPKTSALQPLGTALSIVGNTIGAGFDVISEGIAYATPDIIKEGLEGGAKGLWNMLSPDAQQSTVEAIKAGGETYATFKQTNPNLADAIEGGLNIAAITPLGLGPKVIKKGSKEVASAIKTGKEALAPTILKASEATKGLSKLPAKSLEGTKQGLTRTIPESIVKKDLGFTPTQRAKIEGITGKTESQYILEKGLAGKGKEELAGVFAKQADDNFKGITSKLKAIKDAPAKSKATTEALEDILDQLTSKPKFERAYAKDIKAVKGMLSRGKFSLVEQHNIRKAFDKVNTGMYTAKGQVRSGLDADLDTKLRNAISSELQKGAKKYGIDVKAMNRELRAGIEMKEALLKRLSQEERNNFIGLQDIGVSAILAGGEPVSALALIGAKKYGEAIAPGLAQKAFNLNKSKNVSSRLTRGNPITSGPKSSKLGLASDTRTNLVKPSVKKQIKKTPVKPKVLKPTKQSISKITDVNKLTDLLKDIRSSTLSNKEELIKYIENRIKLLRK